MLVRLVIALWLMAVVTAACATPSQPVAGDSFADLCRALGKTDGTISREELLGAVQDKEQAARIFDACEKNPQGVLTVDEAARQTQAMRELLRLTPVPRVPPPPKGGK